MDEIHERKMQIDQQLFMLKGIIKERKKTENPQKQIQMSATVDKKIFEEYY